MFVAEKNSAYVITIIYLLIARVEIKYFWKFYKYVSSPWIMRRYSCIYSRANNIIIIVLGSFSGRTFRIYVHIGWPTFRRSKSDSALLSQTTSVGFLYAQYHALIFRCDVFALRGIRRLIFEWINPKACCFQRGVDPRSASRRYIWRRMHYIEIVFLFSSLVYEVSSVKTYTRRINIALLFSQSIAPSRRARTNWFWSSSFSLYFLVLFFTLHHMWHCSWCFFLINFFVTEYIEKSTAFLYI